jgi:hypothetical protein
MDLYLYLDPTDCQLIIVNFYEQKEVPKHWILKYQIDDTEKAKLIAFNNAVLYRDYV